jgi:DNA-binding response OmpR family regulator
MRLLIVEDDADIVSMLQRGLAETADRIDVATDGGEGLYRAQMSPYDVIVLDWMLPGLNGIEILRRLRSEGITTPVIMLTARNTVDERVTGLENGADDYLPKPFSLRELRARIEALYRRRISEGTPKIHLRDLTVDTRTRNVERNGNPIQLSAKEYALLLFLIRHKNATVSAAMIEEHLWDDAPFLTSNVIAVTIYHLRQKIGKDLIRSIRGLGYRLEV